MSYGTRGLVPMLALMAMTGCGGNDPVGQGAAAGHEYGSGYRKESLGKGEREALRIREDTARGRRWVLTPDGVKVYDTRTQALIRQIVLPRWSVARILCPPDLALDRAGSALVSSNIEPRLWRVDGESFKVTVSEVKLEEREQWDVGFGAMAFSPGGMLYALTYRGGALWVVDTMKGVARTVPSLPVVLKTCELTPQFVSSFEGQRLPHE